VAAYGSRLPSSVGRALQRADLLLDFAADACRAAGPALLFGLRLWASVCLALYIAFWLQLDDPFWAGTSAALMCQPQLGASLRKGWYRLVGTLVGAVVSVLMTAVFPQERVAFLLALALWCSACAFVATLLRNFAAYAAALAGYTAAIIAADQLGATGGLNGEAFLLAINRASEICIGIVCAGIVLAGTDTGSALRKLGVLLMDVSRDVAGGFVAELARAKREVTWTQPARRELVRRVIALDPVIDQAIGESSELRYHSPVLQAAVDGLFAAMAGWAAASTHLGQLARDRASAEVDTVLSVVPAVLQSPTFHETLALQREEHSPLRHLYEEVTRALTALPMDEPSPRLLADQAARVFSGLAQAIGGLALLAGDPGRPLGPRRGASLRVPDWLPGAVNALRAFVVIVAVELFWIVTAWPNGASAITFAAISVLLFGPRADQAYATAMEFMIGTFLAAAFAAIVAFAVLPGLETFVAFGLALGGYLVPVGAFVTQPRHTTVFTAMAGIFVPLLQPTNVMVYDTAQFYNSALGIVVGCGVAALSLRLVLPLPPAFRTRRLLALSLRDLRRLATASAPPMADDWQETLYGRLSVLPDEASPLQRAQLIAALSAGSEIIRLRQAVLPPDLRTSLRAALDALAQGNSQLAIAWLGEIDRRLAQRRDDGAMETRALRVRAGILAISEALGRHAAYFDEAGLA
jgi:uncharacterized membrane protein YccC